MKIRQNYLDGSAFEIVFPQAEHAAQVVPCAAAMLFLRAIYTDAAAHHILL